MLLEEILCRFINIVRRFESRRTHTHIRVLTTLSTRAVIRSTMQQQTVKTTLSFSAGFLQRVRTIARERRWSMSRVIEADLNSHFEEQEKQRLEKMYAALRKWQGSGSPDVTDASQTIDETLYGADGVWKGSRAE